VYAVEGISGVESRIMGTYYRGEAAEAVVRRMKRGTALFIKPEPTNYHDKNALAIYATSTKGKYIHVGYVEKALAYQIAAARSKHDIPLTEFLSAKANDYSGIIIEGMIKAGKNELYTSTYM
jgi:hypothetical protein